MAPTQRLAGRTDDELADPCDALVESTDFGDRVSRRRRITGRVIVGELVEMLEQRSCGGEVRAMAGGELLVHLTLLGLPLR